MAMCGLQCLHAPSKTLHRLISLLLTLHVLQPTTVITHSLPKVSIHNSGQALRAPQFPCSAQMRSATLEGSSSITVL